MQEAQFLKDFNKSLSSSTPALVHHIFRNNPPHLSQEWVGSLDRRKIMGGVNKTTRANFYTADALREIPIQKGSVSAQALVEIILGWAWNLLQGENGVIFKMVSPMEMHGIPRLFKPQQNPEGFLCVGGDLQGLKTCTDFKCIHPHRSNMRDFKGHTNTIVFCTKPQHFLILDLHEDVLRGWKERGKISLEDYNRRMTSIQALREDPLNVEFPKQAWMPLPADNSYTPRKQIIGVHPPFLCPNPVGLPAGKISDAGFQDLSNLESYLGHKYFFSNYPPISKEEGIPSKLIELHDILNPHVKPPFTPSKAIVPDDLQT